MNVFLCKVCKQWQDNLIHKCTFKFCPCTPEKECDFHKRGGYVTKDDDL